jgi:hypothetical protein
MANRGARAASERGVIFCTQQILNYLAKYKEIQ